MATPTFTPGGGQVATAFSVTIECATPGATIRYNLNGDEPTVYDPVVPPSGLVRVSANTPITAKAWVGGDSSATATGDFFLTGDMSAGRYHGYGVHASGEAFSWGKQDNGRLGNGLKTAGNEEIPNFVKYDTWTYVDDAASLAAGYAQGVMVTQDGNVWGFGYNGNGEVGDNTLTNREFPVRVLKSTTAGDYLTGCVQASGGSSFSGALAASGEVYMWGTEVGGRLGNGAILGNRKVAGKVIRGDIPGDPYLTGIRELSLGGGFALAREANALEQSGASGKVWSWGHNNNGQLGVGNTNNRARAYPVKLDSTTDLTDAWAISGGATHGAVVRWKTGDSNLQGSVWTFGEQQYGRLGNNATSGANVTYPVQVVKSGGAPLDGIVAVAAGPRHTLALDQDGHVWSWGFNGDGELGDGTTTSRGFAAKVQNLNGTGDLEDVVRIAAGGNDGDGFSYAITADGRMHSWGAYSQGQLGYIVTSSSQTLLPGWPTANPLDPYQVSVSITPFVTTGTAPGAVTVYSTVSNMGNDSDRVELYLNGTVVHTFPGSSSSTALTGLAAGTYTVFGMHYDEAGNGTMSEHSTFTIN